jgi:hypothetical protein
MVVRTNSRGFYSKLPLEPGRYVVMARVPGRVQGCAINDVIGGEIARTNINVGYKDVTCSGPRMHPEIVNPDAVGDLYIR